MIKKSIQLTTKPFSHLMRDGEVIDFRLDEPAWMDIYVGDKLEFWEDLSGWDKTPSENARRVQVEVKNVLRASNFKELIDKLSPEFTRQNSKKDIIQNLHQWWSPEKESAIGVLGWHVKII